MNFTEHEMRGVIKGQALPADIRFGESVPAYLVRKFAEVVAGRDRLQEQVKVLAVEADYLRDEIKQHSQSVHFCEVCGKDDPCINDDVCYALSHPIPATDAIIAEIKAQGVDEFKSSLDKATELWHPCDVAEEFAAQLRAKTEGESE